MFANFIYFIIALLIFILYQPTDEPPLTLLKALSLFIVLAFLFAVYTRTQFQRLLRKAQWDSQARLDHRFSLLVGRHSILALILLAVDIWGLHLPSYLASVQWLAVLPTLQALLFLALFVAYLTIVWIFAFDAHRRIYRTDISRRSYVYSNAALSVPILIPWTLLSGIADIIRLLPFEFPKQLLDTAAGQIGYFLIFFLIAAIFAPLLIQRFWRCRPLEAGSHRRRIEQLCHRAGIRYADIVYWPIFNGRMITAGVMGLVARFRYILVTDALLGLLTPDEIDQVIAHEIGHIRRKHLLFYLLFFIGFMLVSYTAFPLSSYFLFSIKPILFLILNSNLDPITLYYMFSAFLLVIGIIFYFRYVFGYFMRNFERQADIFVFDLFSTAQPLIATFDKIVESSGQPADKPNWHHFSIQQRIDYLRKCEHAPAWIGVHDRKVRQSITAFIAGLVLMSLVVFHLNQAVFSTESHRLDVADLEAYLAQKENKSAQDALLYLAVGNLYYARKDFQRAMTAYESAVALDANNADILNNLSWLLVTIEDEALRDPVRALTLAQKAVELKKAPHIWDTLAESLFVNGRIEEAIAAEEHALALNPDDRQIYKDQLAKFKQALN